MDSETLSQGADPGKPVIELNRVPDGSEDRPFWRKDSETLGRVLANMNLGIRYNLRSHRTEWKGLRLTDADVWEPVNQRSLANIREGIARQFFVKTKEGARPLLWGRDSFEETINALVFHHEIDPFEKWLDTLPQWDGVVRLRTLLSDLFGAPADALSEWASRYLFLGGVQRTYEPGCKIDEIPVLIGAQGIGKSAFARAAVPPDLPELFTDGLRFDMREREQVEVVMGRVVVEVSEMAGRGRAEIEHIKAFISRQDDGHVRLVWHRSTEHLPRRFVMIGTTNEPRDLPNDPAGLRRFVPVELEHGADVESHMTEHRNQLWAEALVFYFHQEHRANLPRWLHEKQRERAEDHRDRDDLIEDAVERLQHQRGHYKLGELIDAMRPASDVSQARVVRALKNAGWTTTRTMNGRFWCPPAHDAMTP